MLTCVARQSGYERSVFSPGRRSSIDRGQPILRGFSCRPGCITCPSHRFWIGRLRHSRFFSERLYSARAGCRQPQDFIPMRADQFGVDGSSDQPGERGRRIHFSSRRTRSSRREDKIGGQQENENADPNEESRTLSEGDQNGCHGGGRSEACRIRQQRDQARAIASGDRLCRRAVR